MSHYAGRMGGIHAFRVKWGEGTTTHSRPFRMCKYSLVGTAPKSTYTRTPTCTVAACVVGSRAAFATPVSVPLHSKRGSLFRLLFSTQLRRLYEGTRLLRGPGTRRSCAV